MDSKSRKPYSSSLAPALRFRVSRCPSCRSGKFRTIEQNGVDVEFCERCAGLWFDGGELEEAMQNYEPSLERGAFAADLGDARGPAKKDCPRCHCALNEHRWGQETTVEIDLCPRCSGVWLDREELAHIQAGNAVHEALESIERKKSIGTWLFQFATQLPVEFNFRPRRVPMVTISLIALNLAIFLAQLGGNQAAIYADYALYPERAFGASWWIGLVAHNFLHGGWIHLLGNMYFLWILGDNIEDLFGRARFIAFCTGAALASGLAETCLAYQPDVPTIGFSGIVSAILLSYAVLFRHARLSFMVVILQLKFPVSIWVGIWMGFNLAGLVLESGLVSWLGHVGGALFGLVVGLLAYRPLLRRDPLLRLLNGVRLDQLTR